MPWCVGRLHTGMYNKIMKHVKVDVEVCNE